MEVLTEKKLFFQSPLCFNDPYDCVLCLDPSPLSERAYLEVLRRYKDERGWDDESQRKYLTGRRINERFKADVDRGADQALEAFAVTLRNEVGVCCFSARKDSLLMWAHYADGHRGFCLEFDATQPLFEKAIPVRYSNKVPTIRKQEIFPEIGVDGLVERVISTKCRCWRYEQEWRVLHRVAGTKFGFEPASLRGVWLGAKMSDANEGQIIEMVKSGFPGAHLSRARREERQYRLSMGL